jgi:UDP:flavonoid glycosyltransferase YjiC (YdhE family)
MDRQQPTIAFFCMPEPGHFQALSAVIGRIVRSDLSACVFTHRRFRQQVERLGATFVDLFEKYPIDAVDRESRPIPCRYVSFAGAYGDQIAEELKALRPAAVIYETFSVIGPVVARRLAIPAINVFVNHNPHPERTLLALQSDARVAVSAQCHRAARKLREEFGMGDASPFSYVTGLSPLLNLYGEPAEFLNEQDRAAYEPLAFFGCLPDVVSSHYSRERVRYFADGSQQSLKVYVSFGTIIWRYYSREALAAIQAIADGTVEFGDVGVVVSLGESQVEPGAIAALQRPRVQFLPFVDQCQVLDEADLFVTHHGMNSTHEAIFRHVPMISYPFMADQPALAAKCQQLGLAIALTSVLRGPISSREVQIAFAQSLERRSAIQASLKIASEWERRTMAEREAVIERIKNLL